MKLKIIAIIFALTLLAGCGGSSVDSNEPMTPDMAKNILKLKGFNFDEQSYLQAIKNNDIAAIKAFFDAGINPNAKNTDGENAMTLAVANSELKTVKAVAEKADINLQDTRGQAPLHLALSKQKDDIFNFLLDKGANVNVGGSKNTLRNQTVLYLAVTRGVEDLVQKLLDKGADPNIADSEGGTPLAESCIGDAVNMNIVKMLLDKGANVNQAEKNGATPLFYVADNVKIPSETRVQLLKMLLEKGANTKLKDKNGKTALDYARTRSNKDVIEILQKR